MSKIANEVYDALVGMFPTMLGPRVVKEVYVNYEGQKLYFDFYIRELGVYVEVQGEQHTKFIKHFHGTREAFLKQKYRDNLKAQYVEENGKCLVRFKYNEKITKELVQEKINKVLDGECFYE